MKKVLAAVLSLALALSLAACGGQSGGQTVGGDVENAQTDGGETGNTQTDTAQIPNPFTDYDTLEDAAQAAGYTFAVPESIDGFDTVSYSVMNGGEMLQVIYRNDDNDLTARKAPGFGDISGVYDTYTVGMEVDKDNLPGVSFSGDEEKMYLAIWTDTEYSYSLFARNGMERDVLAALVEQIQVAEAASADMGEETIEGGWTANSGDLSMSANPDAMAAFEKATEGLTGYAYEPLALLGSQVVAGMNYRILCRGTAVVPDAVPTFEIVTIYADLDGGAVITDSVELPGLPEHDENLAGGWTFNTGDTGMEANEEISAALKKALEGLVGAEYEAVAYLASQVVAGENYLLFCRITPVVPDAVPGFGVVTLYAGLDGSAEILNVTDVDF